MSGTVYYCAATLDGFIAEDDDRIEWLTGYDGFYAGPDAELMKGSYDRFYEHVGALAMGSTTYEWILEHVDDWPYAGKPSWVFSSRSLSAPQGDGIDVRCASGKIEDAYDEIASAARGRDIWVVRGGNLASQFADAGLLFPDWPSEIGGRAVSPYAAAAAYDVWEDHEWSTVAAMVVAQSHAPNPARARGCLVEHAESGEAGHCHEIQILGRGTKRSRSLANQTVGRAG